MLILACGQGLLISSFTASRINSEMFLKSFDLLGGFVISDG